MASTMNAEWHQRHPMPIGATLEQRVAWHVKHAQRCGCRPMPASVVAELKRSERAKRRRRP